MTIALSSGLSDKEIEKLVVDAEQYTEQDKACCDIIEESNKAELVCADSGSTWAGVTADVQERASFVVPVLYRSRNDARIVTTVLPPVSIE
jgi:molecular chaperone DnaK (HSP70)